MHIVRDPRNVLSLKIIMNYLKMNLNLCCEKKYIYDYHTKNDFSDFQFISSWENYKSWINQKILPVKLIRYEDFKILLKL